MHGLSLLLWLPLDLLDYAGVRKKEPRTMVAIKGRPKRAKGCLASSARYLAGMVPLYELERKRFAGKTAISGGCTYGVQLDAQFVFQSNVWMRGVKTWF